LLPLLEPLVRLASAADEPDLGVEAAGVHRQRDVHGGLPIPDEPEDLPRGGLIEVAEVAVEVVFGEVSLNGPALSDSEVLGDQAGAELALDSVGGVPHELADGGSIAVVG
jgi:succinate dehydrogenase/fumarate reductase flavoprotein subunit